MQKCYFVVEHDIFPNAKYQIAQTYSVELCQLIWPEIFLVPNLKFLYVCKSANCINIHNLTYSCLGMKKILTCTRF